MENKVNIDTNYMKNVMEGTAKMVMDQSRFSAESYKRNIPIKAWIYKNDNGAGNISNSQVYNVIDQLNSLYAYESNINFYLLCDISEVNNSNYANYGEQYFDDYTLSNKTTGAINVHFVLHSAPPPNREIWGGKANFPFELFPGIPDPRAYTCAVSIGGSSSISKTLGHEIGHTLGLLHTQETSRSSEHYNESAGNCYQEAVSRSKRQGVFCVSTIDDLKCEINGDALCDTQADPGLRKIGRVPESYVDFPCDYNTMDGGSDNWNDNWTPDVTNIMSYAPSNCRNSFSPLQVGKMYGYIGDIGINYPNFEITGPSSICAGQTATYTVNTLPGVTEYTWDPPYNMNILSGQGTNTLTVEAVSDFGGVIKVTPNCGTKTAKFSVLDIFTIDIDGLDQACPLFTYTYTAPDFPSVNYDWSVTHGSIVSGQGTNEVDVALAVHPSDETILDLEVTGLCDGSVFGQKTIVHGDPPPPAQQCFSTRPNSEKTETEKHSDSILAIETGNNVVLSNETNLPVKFTGDLQLYPNPTSGRITIVPPDQTKYTLILYDLLGQVLYRQKRYKKDTFSLNIQNYSSGIYFVKLIGQEKYFTKKLILKK
ncbi:T9SS type A sorting domain-containing protein [Marixanthomonas ophiurae]|uniref:T9SS type A sorting domain-containing protein n=1 Tax=Marixanthomonas ophiurae TaxID=387659 RepID=UPI0013143D2F|nr:T9SS type A sorting domain-containing protein [Marixanthomonas ophiurae]